MLIETIFPDADINIPDETPVTVNGVKIGKVIATYEDAMGLNVMMAVDGNRLKDGDDLLIVPPIDVVEMSFTTEPLNA